MLPITVTIESDAEGVPGLDVEGYVPFADSPLAVTPVFIHRHTTNLWELTDRWAITHRPFGYTLGSHTWPTKEEAYAVLLRCDPTFAAWPLVNGDPEQSATMACRVKLRGALAGG